MKAYRYTDATNGLQLENVPVPKPGVDQVLIQVRAAGMCHTDCHILTGERDNWLLQRPITLGHEVAGEIVETGSNVVGYSTGDRVAVFGIYQPAEERDWSLTIGIAYDGGYAEFATVPASRIKRIPNRVSFAQAAVAMDALATAHQAVVTCPGLKRGSTIAVVGLGGLGMPGLTFAALEGANVYGFDTAKHKFAEAKRLGAIDCFESLEEAKHVSFDVVVDFVGADSTVQAALHGVKEGGKVILVGLASRTLSVPTDALVLRSISLIGSIGSAEADADRVLELLQLGSIDPLLVEVQFDDIPSTLKKLASDSTLEGRHWADPSKAT